MESRDFKVVYKYVKALKNLANANESAWRKVLMKSFENHAFLS
jgi:hypothetical protein